MPSSVLQVKSHPQGTTQVVAATGELDVASVKRAQKAIDAGLAERPETLVIDLSGLSFCDSSGIRLVLAAHRRATSQNVRLVVVRPTGPAGRVFEICRLEGDITVVDVDADDRGPADVPPAPVSALGAVTAASPSTFPLGSV